MITLPASGGGACQPVFDELSIDTALGPINTPTVLRATHINDDPHLDLIAASNSIVSLWQGNGDGTFLFYTAVPYSQSVLFPRQPADVRYDDINNDEYDDIVLSSDTGVWIFYGASYGTFSLPWQYPSDLINAGPRQSLVLADFNGDGFTDIATELTTSLLTVIYGGPSGQDLTTRSWWLPASSLIVTGGDIDGDNSPDILLRHPMIAFSDKDGQFTRFGPSDYELGFDSAVLTDSIAECPWPCVVGDGSGTSTDILITHVNASGAFEIARSWSSPTGSDPIVGVVDLDGNGLTDIIATQTNPFRIVTIRQKVDGGFFPLQSMTPPADSVPVRAQHAVGDFTGDGKPDIAYPVTNDGEKLIRVFQNRIPSCSADLNYDCLIDLADVNLFVTAFTSGFSSADLDDNKLLDLTDVSLFINNFLAGCP